MSIPLPELDDRTWASLVDEGRALVPTLAPDWTNHNPSDPGIVVLELLAWLTETVIYQLDQMPDRNTETFLALLGGRRQPGEPLDDAVRRTLVDLRTLHRAVTAADYETLAATQWPGSPEAGRLQAAGTEPRPARLRAVPRRNLEARTAAGRREEEPAHLSLVVVPASEDRRPQPSDGLCQALWAFLEPRRLLTVRHHVVGPTYVPVELRLGIYLRGDAPPATAGAEVAEAVRAWFHPLRGGPDGTGWPFGRDVHVSEIAAQVAGLALVDFVEEVALTVPGEPDRLLTDGGEVVGVALDTHELVDVELMGLTTWTTDGTRREVAL